VATCEALRPNPALQIRAKLPLDVAREPAVVVLAGVGEGEEGFQILADETVQNGLGRAARQIGGREGGHKAGLVSLRVPGAGVAMTRGYDALVVAWPMVRVSRDR
jgi:hypothetical protein